MSHTDLIETARRLLARPAGESPAHCRDLALCLRRDGETELSHRVEAHAKPPLTFPGGTTTS